MARSQGRGTGQVGATADANGKTGDALDPETIGGRLGRHRCFAAPAVARIAAARNPDGSDRCVVERRGRGFWRLFHDCFEEHAQGVLDFYHAAQNLWKGAKAWLDGRTRSAHQWFVQARRKLRRGKACEVLADIQAALDLEGLPASTHKTLTNLYCYLDKHREHIDYARFKELGLPIGSGIVESACKWLIQQRFKGVGMRWSEDGFNHLLHLRLDWVNGRFDSLFTLAVSPNS